MNLVRRVAARFHGSGWAWSSPSCWPSWRLASLRAKEDESRPPFQTKHPNATDPPERSIPEAGISLQGDQRVTKLHFLGTGSGLLNPARNSSAYLLELEGKDILMDAGEPVSATLARRDYDWSRLAGLVISHTHADHTGGIPMLIQQLHLSGRTSPLDMYAPAEYIDAFSNLLALHYTFIKGLCFKVNTYSLQEALDFRLCGVSFSVFTTRHLKDAAARGRKLGYACPGHAFAFRLKIDGTRLFYSGDVASFNDISTRLSPCDVAIVDSTHVELADVVSWAADHAESVVYLSHVAPGFDTAGLKKMLEDAGVTSIQMAPEGGLITL